MPLKKIIYTFLILVISLVLFNVVQAVSIRLIKTADNPKVYLVDSNRRVHIPNEEVFEAGGYKWNNIKIVSQKEMDSIPDTALIKSPKDAKVYLVKDGTKQWIPNEKTFLDVGLNWSDIILISQPQVEFYQEKELNIESFSLKPKTEIKLTEIVVPKQVAPIFNENLENVKEKKIKTFIDNNPVTLIVKEQFLGTKSSLLASPIELGNLRATNVYTQPFSINENDEVVGSSIVEESDDVHAFLWRQNKMIDLGTFGGHAGTVALAVNNRTQIVGYSHYPFTGVIIPGLDQSGPLHAFLWEGEKMIDLGTLGGDHLDGSTATDINDNGEIVGDSTVSGETSFSHAFFWRNQIMSDLGTLGGDNSRALSINNNGQVVGYAETKYGKEHAFLWVDGVMKDLSLNTPFANGTSRAIKINNKGQIIGVGNYKIDEQNQVTRSFLWENGTMIIFSFDRYGEFMDINDKGEIIGAMGLISNGEVYSLHNESFPNATSFEFVLMAINNKGNIAVEQMDSNNNNSTIGLLFKKESWY